LRQKETLKRVRSNEPATLGHFEPTHPHTLAFAAAGLAQLWHFEPQTSTKLPVALKLPLARRTSVQLHQRRREHERSLLALPGFALFALLLALVLSHAPQPFAPPIADVSTDPNDPPSFAPIASDTHAATADRLARNVSRLPSVAPPPPHNTSDATIEMIQHAFPRLRTLHTTLPPAAALSRAHNVCTALHWHVVATSSLPNDRFVVSGADLRLLATRRSFLLIHDVSDLAIRVRAASAGHAGSRVDVRSRSRDRDGGDLGQNAEAIRRFLAHELWEESIARPNSTAGT